MAFALATGRWIAGLADSELLRRTGFGSVRTAQDHPGWLIAADAMSQISQPPDKSSAGPGWRVAFDGYLANCDEFSAELERAPTEPKADPAGLVAALLTEQGPGALNRLIGNFALACGRTTDGAVLLMRDRLGGRTLYYTGSNGNFVVASRSAWVVHLAGQGFAPDRRFLLGHFALQTAPAPGRTALDGVVEVLPGEQVSMSRRRIETDRRPLDLTADFDYRHPGDCIARFRQLLEEAVQTALPADGDVACMLSGGLDSGPVAVLADRELVQLDRRLHVCSWKLEKFPDADESPWIKMAAEALSQPIELFDGSPLVPFSRTDDSTICPDLPAYNAFRLLVNECYRRAASHDCRVILNGNAGDQLYAPPALVNVDRLKRRQWRPVWNDLVRTWRAGGIPQIISNPTFRHPIGRLARPFRRDAGPPDWMTADAAAEWQAVQSWPPELEDMPYPDYAWQLVGTRMAFGRAHESEFPNRSGVDRRDPYHDEALIRFMLHAPFGLSYRRGWDKWIMRRASKGLLPDALRRKQRTGLLHSFFRAGLQTHRDAVRQLLFEQETDWQRFVKADLIEAILSRSDHPREVLVCQCLGHALWMRSWAGAQA